MKKSITNILILLILTATINATTYEEEFQKLKPMDLDEVIKSIELEFGLLYNKEKINNETLRIYRVPAYSNPKDVSVKYQFVNGVKQYEYLGYSPNGEKITNSLYPPDGDMTDKYIDNFYQFDCIENLLVFNSKHLEEIGEQYGSYTNHLDFSFNLHLREKYLENFLIGIELNHGEGIETKPILWSCR